MKTARILLWAAIACCPFSHSSAAAEQLIIASDGQSPYQIVLPDQAASPTIEQSLDAIGWLMQSAFAINGFDLPVVRESDRDANQPGIFIGGTRFARDAGINLAELEGWSYIHKTVGDSIIIAGNDQPTAISDPGSSMSPQDFDRVATAKAAVDFLREYVGTRFLYADIGTTLNAIRNVDLANSPAIEFLPRDTVAIPADLNQLKDIHLLYNIWRSRGSFSHIANNEFPLFNTAWDAHTHQRAVPADKYYDSHPEYFALIRGNRMRGVQYCISNPEFQELVYRYLADAFDSGHEAAYLGHSDGFRPCQCEACHDLYETGDDWTEKLWIFNRAIAERLNESHPEKTVVLVAYTVTERHAPKTFDSFPPNTMLMLCGTNEWDLAKWENTEIPRGLTSYIYNWTPNQTSRYIPMTTPLSLEKQVKRLYEANIRGIYRDGGGPYLAGLEGPAGYVFGRMWDDPENNRAADLKLEFLEAAFGSAAAPMRRFYDQLYHHTELYAHYLGTRLPGWTYTPIYGRGRKHVTDLFQMVGFMFPPSLLANLNTELAQAEKAADNDRVRARLALVRRELTWVEDLARVIHLHHAVQMAPDNIALYNELLDAIDTRNATIKSWYNERGQPTKPHPAWGRPLFPPSGHNANHLRLAENRYQESVAQTPLNWDTTAMRAAIRAATQETVVRRTTAAVNLSSADWNEAEVSQLTSLPSASPGTLKSELRLLYGKDRLYVWIRSELPTGWTPAAPANTDVDFRSREAVEIYLRPRSGEDIYYRFAAGPSGERFDAARGLITDDMNLRYGRDDPDWSGEWDCSVDVNASAGYWTALFSIPYSTLGTTPAKPGDNWQANFSRIHRNANGELESYLWSGNTSVDDLAAMGNLRF